MDFYTGLILMHIVGTVLGVGGATFAEVNMIRALRDGEISFDESELMKATYAVLRLGFFMLIISGFGFLLYYRLIGAEELLYSEKLWAKLTIIVALALNAIFMQMHLMPIIWGSAISFASWYGALILGILRGADYTYFGVLVAYVISVILMYFVIGYVHKIFIPQKKHM